MNFNGSWICDKVRSSKWFGGTFELSIFAIEGRSMATNNDLVICVQPRHNESIRNIIYIKKNIYIIKNIPESEKLAMVETIVSSRFR